MLKQERASRNKILIVDDNAFCLIGTMSLFQQYQFECD